MKLNFHDKINAGITNNFLSFSPSFVKLRNLLAQFVAAYIEGEGRLNSFCTRGKKAVDDQLVISIEIINNRIEAEM